MKPKALLIVAITLIYSLAKAQTKPNTFTGATANLKSYKALYIIDESSEKKMKGILRNIKNAMEDPRLKGKLQVELVAFGDGVDIFKKSTGLDSTLLTLQKRGVILAQCENTIRERKIDKAELWPFISYVPSGNGEIIIREYQGWATVHP